LTFIVACNWQRQEKRLEHLKLLEAQQIQVQQQHQMLLQQQQQQLEQQQREQQRRQHQLQMVSRLSQAQPPVQLAPQQRPQTGGIQVSSLSLFLIQ
jgi:hypothetical protein